MLRLLVGPGFVGFVMFLLWAYCILDVIATDELLMRNIKSKMTWIFIVVFIPTIGSLAWLLLGRPLYAGFSPGSTEYRPRYTYGPPEDDDEREPRRGPDDEPA